MEIPFSKKALGLMIALCLFVLIIFLGIILYNGWHWGSIVSGLVGFFIVYVLQFSVNKWLKAEPAIILNEVGLVDNTSALAVGMIEWGQIRAIKEKPEFKSVVIVVKNPNYFINREKNVVKKFFMILNSKFDESPIHINDMLLDIDFWNLVKNIKFYQKEGDDFNDLTEHLVD